jgi:protein O-GlcNAc transferase
MTEMTLQSALEQACKYHNEGRLKEAEAMYRDILRVDPRNSEALHLMGYLAGQVGNSDVAARLINSAIQIAGANAPMIYFINLAGLHLSFGQALEAETVSRMGLERDKTSSGLWNNLGNSIYLQGRISEAADCFKLAYDSDKTNNGALSNWANILQETGKIREAMEAHRLAATIGNSPLASEDNYLRDVGFLAELDPIFVRNEHTAWGEAYEKTINPNLVRNAHKNSLDAKRKLKIGFISPDFRLHSVTYFIEPLLRHMDRENFALYCYSNVGNPDDTTTRLQSYPLEWRNIKILSDIQAAEMIENDGIDILIDLGGHTSDNRCRLLVYRPAPMQMTYLGYPFSVGLQACQYRISDEITDPVGLTETHYNEQLLRLPHSTWCFEPPTFQRPVAPTPVLKNGYITFGSFNTYNKINDFVLDAWAQIMTRVPTSRMIIKSHGLGDEAIRQQLLARFHARGIDGARFQLLGREQKPENHLEYYSQMDIALDTFPYNGTTTSCEALWQGLPIVVLEGKSHVSRVGVCLNNALDLEELTARDTEHYIQIATDLAADIERVTELRKSMRQRVAESLLCDQPAFARHFETMLRNAWQTFCDDNRGKK